MGKKPQLPEQFLLGRGDAHKSPLLARQPDLFSTPQVALGAALLAGVASDIYEDCAQAGERAVSIAERFEPDETGHRTALEYRKGYEQFYRALAPMRERVNS